MQSSRSPLPPDFWLESSENRFSNLSRHSLPNVRCRRRARTISQEYIGQSFSKFKNVWQTRLSHHSNIPTSSSALWAWWITLSCILGVHNFPNSSHRSSDQHRVANERACHLEASTRRSLLQFQPLLHCLLPLLCFVFTLLTTRRKQWNHGFLHGKFHVYPISSSFEERCPLICSISSDGASTYMFLPPISQICCPKQCEKAPVSLRFTFRVFHGSVMCAVAALTCFQCARGF